MGRFLIIISSSRNPANIRNPLIYFVNCCFLMFGRVTKVKPCFLASKSKVYLVTLVSSYPNRLDL